MSLPTLQSPKGTDCVLLAVYAPFGTDATLSGFPDGSTRTLVQHPLYTALTRVASHGIHVAALIDLVKDDTYLVEIPAFHPGRPKVTSMWKERMESPNALAGFLRHAHASHPTAAVVLALEGHGAGFLPEIDASQLTPRNITDNGRFEWHITATQGAPVLPQGAPLLPQGAPLLPQGAPLLPTNHMPLSTWGLGAALKSAIAAGVPRPSVIHLNNCFNMSVELLHTIAPYGEFAAGYCNYNFFSSGEAYPSVFKKLQAAGSASSAELAAWFSDANRDMLEAKGNHPTIGGVLELGRMKEVAERIDDLADALLSALRTALPAFRQGVVDMIRDAIIAAKQYDTEPGFQLETPDQLTDIYSFATSLLAFDFGPHGVKEACIELQKALEGIKRYGSNDFPWVDDTVTWDFSEKTLAMNIFMPDPLLDGLWDWRSPYYLDVNPDPNLPRVQPEIIDFVKVTDWVDFIIEYHRDAKFQGLLPAAIPSFPIFNARYVPPGRQPPPPPPPPDSQTPYPPAPSPDPGGTAPPKASAA